MRLPQTPLSSIKNILHAIQSFLLFLSWILTIAVYTRKGQSDGRTGWFFGLCWLTIPALVYLVMVPMWSRARRFAHAYAFSTLDILFTILWFSAWIAVASYVAEGKKKKSKDSKNNASGCDNWAYGSPAKCKLSEATVFLGVGIFLLFIGTSFLSIRAALHFRQTGTMPSSSDPKRPLDSFAAQTQAAFSSNPRNGDVDPDFDLDADDDLHTPPQSQGHSSSSRGGRGRDTEDDEYALLHHNESDDVAMAHPGRPVSYGQPDAEHGNPPATSGPYRYDTDTSYAGPYGQHAVGSAPENPFGSHADLSQEGDYNNGSYGGAAPPRYGG